MKSKRKGVGIKVEATPGTEATLAGATDYLAAIDFKWDAAAKAVTDEFEYASGGYGSRDKFMVSLTRECSFTLPLVGAGAPLGTNFSASWLAVWRACGHAVTPTTSTNVLVNPISAGEEAATLNVNEDGFLRKMTFARGSMKWMFEEGKVPRMAVALMGMYSTPADLAMPAITLPVVPKSVGFSKSNTVVTLGGTTLKVSSIEIDEVRTHTYRNLANAEDIVPMDCRPTVSMKFELPVAAVKNLYSELETTTTQTLAIAHGTVVGNRVGFGAARAQLVDMSEGDDRGVIFTTAKFELLPTTAGNDHYLFTFT
ncbi:hypothetical protein [Rhodoferax sp. WC2427]|uniref:hypothetical protein n=1 Tax=Rhodoferax sp. WC2427 TaxID=3234144 RepID=UPI003467A934